MQATPMTNTPAVSMENGIIQPQPSTEHGITFILNPIDIEPSTTCDDSATKLVVVAGSSQSGDTLVNRSINAMSVVGRIPATSCDDW